MEDRKQFLDEYRRLVNTLADVYGATPSVAEHLCANADRVSRWDRGAEDAELAAWHEAGPGLLEALRADNTTAALFAPGGPGVLRALGLGELWSQSLLTPNSRKSVVAYVRTLATRAVAYHNQVLRDTPAAPADIEDIDPPASADDLGALPPMMRQLFDAVPQSILDNCQRVGQSCQNPQEVLGAREELFANVTSADSLQLVRNVAGVMRENCGGFIDPAAMEGEEAERKMQQLADTLLTLGRPK